MNRAEFFAELGMIKDDIWWLENKRDQLDERTVTTIKVLHCLRGHLVTILDATDDETVPGKGE